MKTLLLILALLIAVPPANVRADDERTQFLQSLAVPLSPQFPLLPQNSYAIVLSRHKTEAEATDRLKTWKNALPTDESLAQNFKLEVRRGS